MINLKALSNALLRKAVAPVAVIALFAGTASASVIYNVTVITSSVSLRRKLVERKRAPRIGMLPSHGVLSTELLPEFLSSTAV